MVIRALLVVAVAGCLAVPDHANTMYACDKDPRCPDGFSCVDGVCVGGGSGMGGFGSGSSNIGCNAGMLGCGSDAQPEHEVVLSAFSIDQTEVSQVDYMACVAAGVCCSSPSGPCQASDEYRNCQGQGLCDPTSKQPMRFVNWDEAKVFCNFRGGFQLPTEAQWERAARTQEEPFPWGTSPNAADCSFAITQSCTGPVPVDQSMAGDRSGGLHHMLGNVREWVEDNYDSMFYMKAESRAPNPRLTAGDNTRVVRGGAFDRDGSMLAVWTRDHEDNRLSHLPDVGFRCAR
jgi:formylglycine-generating enzyme required for sulfatase activity